MKTQSRIPLNADSRARNARRFRIPPRAQPLVLAAVDLGFFSFFCTVFRTALLRYHPHTILPFKVDRSIPLIVSSPRCANVAPKRKGGPIGHLRRPQPLSSPRRSSSYFPALRICHVNGIIQYAILCDWLRSLSAVIFGVHLCGGMCR